MPKLVLASESQRRRDLLSQINIKPDHIIAANIDETPLKKELPIEYVKRMSEEKAKKVFENHSDFFVIAADTVVAMGRRILPKAESDEHVRNCLNLISGRQHTVITSVCVLSPDNRKSKKNITTKVKFKLLTKEEIDSYIGSQEGIGKAGGYAIQGLAGQFIRRINGSYSSVVGLPLYETMSSLNGMGYL